VIQTGHTHNGIVGSPTLIAVAKFFGAWPNRESTQPGPSGSASSKSGDKAMSAAFPDASHFVFQQQGGISGSPSAWQAREY
jgi:hypothetical protein